jgi:hypothetical protein
MIYKSIETPDQFDVRMTPLVTQMMMKSNLIRVCVRIVVLNKINEIIANIVVRRFEDDF